MIPELPRAPSRAPWAKVRTVARLTYDEKYFYAAFELLIAALLIGLAFGPLRIGLAFLPQTLTIAAAAITAPIGAVIGLRAWPRAAGAAAGTPAGRTA